MTSTWKTLILSLLCALAPALAVAQTATDGSTEAVSVSSGALAAGRRSMTALRLNEGEAIRLDGRLDETVWSRAVPAKDFIQQDPRNGEPATEATEVRIAYTRDALYIGAICHDSEPDKLIAFGRRRDEFLQADDRFMWTIDTFLNGRTGYFFEMNPAGLMADALLGGTFQNRQWDGIWDARVDRSEIGWTVEIELPFRTLNFDPNSDTWGINFQRTVRRKNEDSLWSGWMRNQGLQRMANAGLVTGIQGVSQGRGLEIKPYGLVQATDSPGQEDVVDKRRRDVNGGLDISYSVTPGLRAILTAKTDFAQTEVDRRQTNLTRFSLFFPERRDFFLDGSPFFEVRTIGPNPAGFGQGGGGGGGVAGGGQNQGGGAPLLTPFFSRRIGLSTENTPQPINFGTKLIGQVGAQDVGVLHVQTANEGAFVGEDFTVARIKRRMLRESYVGLFYTRRAPRIGDGPTLQTGGGDFRFATSRFRGSSNLEVSGYFLKSPAPGDGGRNAAFGGDISYPNDRWSGRMMFREVQERFEPAVGFSTRNGYRMYAPSLYFSPRPRQHPYVRRVQFGVDMFLLRNPQDTTTLLRTVQLTLPQIDLHSSDNIQVQITPTEELLDSDFELGDITLPAGSRYRFTRYEVQVRTASRRLISVTPSVEWGGFYSGNRLKAESMVNLRIRTGLLIFLSGEWNRVRLPEGEYRTKLIRLTQEAQFSPRLSFVNNVQYDTQSAVLGWQSRFRWILDPGNDLYVVYTHNWVDDPVRGGRYTLERTAASKIVYTRRF